MKLLSEENSLNQPHSGGEGKAPLALPMEGATRAPTIEVVAAIIQHKGKFLITKRLAASHLGHLWEFPGGKIKPGETLEATAIRECLEEVGILIKPLRKYKELRHDYPELSVHLHFILCDYISGHPQALECAEWKWVRPDRLQNFEFPEADANIIRELSAHLS